MIIARRECVIPVIRRGEIGEKPIVIGGDKCTGCKACILLTGCPALVYDPETRKVKIDELLCTGCGVCNQTCPFDAIKFPSELEKGGLNPPILSTPQAPCTASRAGWGGRAPN